MQGRLTGAYTQRSHAAFEGRDALFEHVIGGVADASVTMSFHFEVEECCSMLCALECVGDGLIDRYRNRPGRRLNIVSAVDGDCFVTQLHASPVATRSVRNHG